MEMIKKASLNVSVLALMVLGLCYKTEWAMNVVHFLSWFTLVSCFIATFYIGTEKFNESSLNGEINRTLPKWWTSIMMAFSAGIMASHAQFFYAGVYIYWFIICNVYYDSAEKVIAEQSG